EFFMDLTQSDRQMIADVTRMGIRTAVLLRGVMLQKVDGETLKWGLSELAVSDLMNKYFPFLVDKTEYVNLLNLLFLVYSLDGQLDYQITEYGIDSLKDDLEEINFSLRQIGDTFDLPRWEAVV
ncbi:MAG: hypothetical protein WB554_15100, partial [Desulfomonilaceae bacterium]